jgi:copper(I)-binding protein
VAEEDAGALDCGGGVAAPLDEDRLLDAEDVGCGDAAAAGALPTATRGVIFLMVAAETPAFDKSLAEEYGRPETIFFAVAAPTPGRVSNSFSLAVFKSSGAAGSLEAAGFADAAGLLAVDVAGAAAGAALPKVTNGVIFLTVAAETPAFVKSLAEE